MATKAKAMTFRDAFTQSARQLFRQRKIGVFDLLRLNALLLVREKAVQTAAAQHVVASGGVAGDIDDPYTASMAWDWSAFLALIIEFIMKLLEMFNM